MLRYNTILLTRDVSGTVTLIWLVFDFQAETPVFTTELHFVYLSTRRPSTRNSCLLARCGNTLQEKPRRPGLGSTPVGRPFRPTARGTASPEGTCSDLSGPSGVFPVNAALCLAAPSLSLSNKPHEVEAFSFFAQMLWLHP